MNIRFANSNDREELAKLRSKLWPDSINESQSVLEDYFTGKPSHIDQIIVAEHPDFGLVGFAELRIRNYAEGSENLEVPFLEGWFVVRDYRRQGIGR